MAQTELKTFKGKGQWVKVFTPDTSFGDPAWKMKLYLTQEGVEQFRTLKVKNHIMRDADGDYVNLKRPVSKPSKNGTINFAPPIVVNPDGTPFQGNSIGNGSDLTVQVEHYGWQARQGVNPGFAIRLHTVQVDNLVPYQPNNPVEKANEPVTQSV